MKYTTAYTDQRKDRKGQPWVGHLKYRDGNRWRQVAKTFDAETVKTEEQAEKALQEWRIEMELLAAMEAKQLPSVNTTVEQYVTSYIDTLEAAGSVRPSAISDYRTSCKRITEGIGDVTMGELTPAVIQAWEARLLKSGKGVNTVLKYHRLLNSVCKHAMAVRDLDWNPCAAVKKPRRVAPTPNSLSRQQYAQLIATLGAMAPTPIITAAAIAACTGMREGECCGLKWACYDSEAGTISVERSVAKAGGKQYITEPKTNASRRIVPVSRTLAGFLSRRREEMLRELEEAGITPTCEEFSDLFVCGDASGKFLDNTHLSRSWKALAESLDLIGSQSRRCTFHDLRHTFATLALAARADVVAVSKVLGHASVAVTLNTYADALPEGKRRAVTLMDEYTSIENVLPFAELASAEK